VRCSCVHGEKLQNTETLIDASKEVDLEVYVIGRKARGKEATRKTET
jgi:hypothetical protein